MVGASDRAAEPVTRRYEGFPLEAVLERVHAVHGAAATITAAERIRRGGIGGFFAREVFQVTVVVDPESVAAPVAAPAAASAPAGLADPTDEIDPEDVEGAVGLPDLPLSTEDLRDAEIWALLAAATASASPVVPETPAPAPVADAAPAPVVATPVIESIGAGRLAAALERFDGLAVAPPLPDVGVVAVVGAKVEALQVAARIAAQLGVPADEVVVAAPSAPASIPTPDDIVRFAATVRFKCNPVAIVAVELVAGRLGHDWARAVLGGLQAEQVRFAVAAADAGHGPHVLTALGGAHAVDLLAVDAADPEDALSLGVPVATLDGRPASPELWAAASLAAQLREAPMVDLSTGIGR